MGYYTWHESLRYLKKRFPKTGVRTLYNSYYDRVKTRSGSILLFSAPALDSRLNERVSVTNIAGILTAKTRFSMLKVDRNPYFPEDATYFEDLRIKRSVEYFEFSSRQHKLIKRQKGRCDICCKVIEIEDKVEIDHIIPIADGGEHKLINLRLIHKSCHRYIVHGRIS